MADRMEVIDRAKDRISKCWNALSKYRDEAADDDRVMNGDPWRDEIKFKRGKRPMEVVNDSIINKRKVINGYSKQQATYRLRPRGIGVDQEKTDIYNAAARAIQRDSMSNFVMDEIMDDMLSAGMGFAYYTTEYESPYSDNQIIVMNKIQDKYSVFFDIDHKRMDMSDMDYGGFLIEVDREEANEEYNKTNISGFSYSDSHVNNLLENSITLCQYYEAYYEDDTLITVADPRQRGVTYSFILSEAFEDKNRWLIQYYTEFYEDFDGEKFYEWLKPKIISERPTQIRKIKVYTLSDDEILDEEDWAGKYIPIVPMLGDKYYLEDNMYYWSLVRSEKGPVRTYNFMMSNYVERLALQPVTPFIGAAGKFKGHERIWAQANNNPIPWLPYSPIQTPDGSWDFSPPIPAPEANVGAGLLNGLEISATNKRNTSGYQDNTFGVVGPEASGRALIERESNSLQSANVFYKRRKFSTILQGKIEADLIPKIYDAPRMMSLLGEDGKENTVLMNAINTDGDWAGKSFNLSEEEFDVVVDVGPSRDSRRLEDQETLMKFMTGVPEHMKEAVVPRVAGTIDISDNDGLVADLKKLQSPALQDEEEKTEEQLKAEIAQKDQQMQQMQLQIQEMEKVLLADRVKSEARLKETQLKVNGDLERESIKQEAETERKLLDNRNNLQTTQMQTSTDLRQTQIDAAADIRGQQLQARSDIETKKLDIEGEITLEILKKQIEEANNAIRAISVQLNT